ncbi:hypothetical protein ACHAPJ_007173 [Fusarium lateritium]
MADEPGGSPSRESNTLDHPIDLKSREPRQRLPETNVHANEPQVKEEDIATDTTPADRGPSDERDRYPILDEDGHFPCTQVVPNSVILAWRRVEGGLPKDKVPAFMVGPNFRSQEDFRFLGDEYAPGAEPSKFKPTDLDNLVGRSRFFIGTWWKFLNLEGRTYWQPSDPWKELEHLDAALRLLGLESSILGAARSPWAEYCAINTSAELRGHIAERNRKNLKKAKEKGKASEDLEWDEDEMVLKWDGMVHQVTRALAAGKLQGFGDINLQ